MTEPSKLATKNGVATNSLAGNSKPQNRELIRNPDRHLTAPPSLPNMSVTDLALGIDPRNISMSKEKAEHSQSLTGRMSKIAAIERKRDAKKNAEYLLQKLKKPGLYVRRPSAANDHITRVTQLIESERLVMEVDEALKSVKDGFAAEMERCLKRKNDSVRKNGTLVETLQNFSEFLELNDRWTKYNIKRASEEEKMTKFYEDERIKLLQEQEEALRHRRRLQAKRSARKKHQSFILSLLSQMSGYNGLEHLVTDLEQEISIIAVSRNAVIDLQNLSDEAEKFGTRLRMAVKAKLDDTAEKLSELETKKVALESEFAREQLANLQLVANQSADVQQYFNIRRDLFDIYMTSCFLVGKNPQLHKNDRNLQLSEINKCLQDTHIILAAANHVFHDKPSGFMTNYKKADLTEVTSLIGSGFFLHLPYKVQLKPPSFVS